MAASADDRRPGSGRSGQAANDRVILKNPGCDGGRGSRVGAWPGSLTGFLLRPRIWPP